MHLLPVLLVLSLAGPGLLAMPALASKPADPLPGQSPESAAPVVRMALIEVKPGMRDAFVAAVTAEMRASLAKEPGVLALYCVADEENPDKLTFFELYASEEAYQQHRDTPHFKQYIETTKDMTVAKKLLTPVPVELRDQSNTAREY